MYTAIFVLPNGEEFIANDVKEGENLLNVAHRNALELEGACEGSLACATCHVIVDQEWFDKLDDVQEASEDEEDMLDFAFNLTTTSRLGCQIKMCKELDGIRVIIPSENRNIASS
tara:strand:- start:2956 stop:3300 length:345 start_codon:yes stop_codon:yes gene_type:complete